MTMMPLLWVRDHWGLTTLVGIAAGLVLSAWALLAPSSAIGAGWLVGFLFWLSVAVGALLLLAICALTGGRWGERASPALRPAAATVPIFFAFGLPVVLSLPALFPWARQWQPDDVTTLYLATPAWLLRSIIAIAIWTVLAFLLLRANGPHRLIAAIGLCLHGVIVTLIGIDWILSVHGRFYSTAFGAALATLQILAALSWIAIARVVPSGGAGGSSDLGGLIIATALGSLYLGFSQYLVIWYGNIPERVTWYIDRQHGPWPWIDLLGIFLSGILPVFVLMKQRWRADAGVVATVGAGVLLGLLAHLVWLIAPEFGLLTIAAAMLATVAIGGPWLALTCAFAATRLDQRHAL